MAIVSDLPPEAPTPPEPEDHPAFPWWSPFAVGLSVYLGLGVMVAIIAVAAGWDTTLPARFTLLATLVQDALLVAGAVAVAALAGPKPLRQLGVRRFVASKGLGWAVLAFVGFFAFLAVWSSVLDVTDTDDLPGKLG